MANSRFEYVRKFEQSDSALPSCWIVVRIDGRGFSKFVSEHKYIKPNDIRGIQLMSLCAAKVLAEFPSDVVLAYGQSDEYSFVIHKKSELFTRRVSKLISTIVSCFTSCFVFYWNRLFSEELRYPPMFDGRVICYPTDEILKDYLSWRQADCHINNLYNTCFWSLVNEGGRTPKEAESDLKGTLSSDKNELLFSKFGINYNSIEAVYRKGTILIHHEEQSEKMDEEFSQSSDLTNAVGDDFVQSTLRSWRIQTLHEDLISPEFWAAHSSIMEWKKSNQIKKRKN
jgi:tRNA(His) guanylyltransferase